MSKNITEKMTEARVHPFPDLRRRSNEPELMDADNANPELLYRTLHELEVINRWLGGYATTLAGLKTLLGVSGRDQNSMRLWRIVDVGCGGGDTLRAIADWGQTLGLRLQLTGLDLQPVCLEYARKHSQGYAIDWISGDFRAATGPYDLVISSQFCHHLDDALMREFFAWTRRVARYGYLINDLQRHRLAYHSIHALTALLSRSPYVRYDGPMSVRRAWTRAELQNLAASAGLHPQIEWKWAFRYLVTGYV
ncbi:MAG: SAM-dependent methyltransferase [Candidatus Melainabacteria bacterium HGW-Melainabacteria-1]|nr:MAG: SAM-dependent methyltransferase [Candidatus Melainabacteria bacterium HGW-Melainabacteria-1]